MSVYKLYLDGVLINQHPKGLDDLKLSIVRENGFGNSEQILREDTDTQFEFWGDGFQYICAKIKENYCEEILCTIMAECDDSTVTVFEGLIKQSKVEVLLTKCICKVNKLKDNSFSGLIRDFLNVEVDLSNIKTRNCFDIQIQSLLLGTPTHPTTYTIADIKIYDCLSVFKYLVAYFTDNRIAVKSNYLTNNSSLYAITTGYNMHNDNYNNSKAFPKVSISSLFNDLRKKLVLYMGIEYETDGTPYLRIENEDYFFTDDELLVINDIPLDAVEKLDQDKLYNDIKVGSKTVKLLGDALATMPQKKLVGWNEEVKTGCGGCNGDKDSTLDLLSDFIIDGNIIHEALKQAENTEYENDDKIFLLHYNYTGIPAVNIKLVGNNTSIYNISLNNENTLKRWVGVSNSCIKTNNEDKYAFYIEEEISSYPNNNAVFIHGTNNELCGSRKKNFITSTPKWFDNFPSLISFYNGTTVGACPETLSSNPDAFKCNENGTYKFKANLENIRHVLQGTQTQHAYNVTHELHILVYNNNSLTTQLHDFYSTVFVPDGVNIASLEVVTPEVDLLVGNIVFVYLKSFTQIVYQFDDFTFEYDKISFESIPAGCTTIEDELDNFKPFLTDFQYPICLEDYLKIKQNKRGYILLKGQKTWIKNVSFIDKKMTEFSLIHKESFCGCD